MYPAVFLIYPQSLNTFCGHLMHRISSKLDGNIDNIENCNLLYGFHFSDFHDLQLLTGITWSSSAQNFTQTDHVIWKVQAKLIYAPKVKYESQPIYTKLTFALPFVKNAYLEFHEHSSNCLVADTESQTEGRKNAVHTTGVL